MANILDYIAWRGDLDFSASPFNEIDALILSQISYLDFSGLLEKLDFSERPELHEIEEKFRNAPDFDKRSYLGLFINPLTVKLFSEAASCERFSHVRVCGFVSVLDTEIEEQFSALSFILPGNMVFAAFRGTDDAIVGWKEDFNLAVCNQVPAQRDAVIYLEKMSSALEGRLIVGGHSKGGNLAIYSSAFSSEKVRGRIEAVFNFDGPGFTSGNLRFLRESPVMPLVKSFYPQFSVVGMLFDHFEDYSVVESDASGLMQHDPFSWHLAGKKFTELPALDRNSLIFHKTFNLWISKMSPEQISKFVETVFKIIESTDARTNTEIEKKPMENSMKILKALFDLDEETRDSLWKISGLLFESAHKSLPKFPWETDE